MADYAMSPSARPTFDEGDVLVDMQAKIEALEIQLESSDAKVRPHILFYLPLFFPPHLATRSMTQSQIDHQVFPFSIPKSDSFSLWLVITVLKFTYLYHRLIRIFHNPTYTFTAQTPNLQFIILLGVGCEVLLLISLNAYPILYACLLTSKKGRWPTRIQVWGTEREKERERERGEGGSPVKGFVSFLTTVMMGYSVLGGVIRNLEVVRAKRREKFHGRGYVLGGGGV